MTIVNALSVDVEDWYQVSDFTGLVDLEAWDRWPRRLPESLGRVLDVLERHGARATFFVLAWNAERDPGLVKAIHAAGHEVASHGYAHRLVYGQTPDEFRADVARSLDALQAVTGERVLGYRAPSFSITGRSRWALDVLLDLGLAYDASVFPIRRGLYGVPAAPRFPHTILARGERRLLEFPMSTVRIAGVNVPFSGGGYLRLLPARAVEAGVAWLNRGGHPAHVYVHPWELDPEQPRLRPARRTWHYVNLGTTAVKLERLLRRFRFAPVRDVLAVAGARVA